MKRHRNSGAFLLAKIFKNFTFSIQENYPPDSWENIGKIAFISLHSLSHLVKNNV